MITYLEYWRLPQYLTHIYNQFTTVTFLRNSSNDSFKFTVNTTVSVESFDLVCANATIWFEQNVQIRSHPPSGGATNQPTTANLAYITH